MRKQVVSFAGTSNLITLFKNNRFLSGKYKWLCYSEYNGAFRISSWNRDKINKMNDMEKLDDSTNAY